MEKEQLFQYIKTLVPEVELANNTQFVEVVVPPAQLHQLAVALRNDDKLKFDYLYNLCGIDYLDSFGVVYHLESTSLKQEVVVKVKTTEYQEPKFDTVSDIWATAEFQEREVYDLMGIQFNNHPDMRRLFLEEGWGFPLRKDYKDDFIIER